MNIGIIGCGVVGNACKFGFEKLGHKVFIHDIKLNTTIENVINTDIIFISVPTPQNEDGSCDTSIVENTVRNLLHYKGLICIKSTVKPTTTEKLIKETNLNICFVPEFLRERCAITDFVENHKLLAVGCLNKENYDLIVSCHGNYPKNIAMLTPTEAELLKYYHNSFNAMRIVFANEFYEVCKTINANYTNVKNCLIKSGSLPDIYLDVNENCRGYISPCFDKDLPALCAFVKELGLNNIKIFDTIVEENNKFTKTVFDEMRKSY